MADTSALWPGIKAELCNICHNLKGQGSSFGYPLITQIGLLLNKILKGLEECDPRCAEIAQAHVRALSTVLEKNIQGACGAGGLALVQRLQKLSSEID